MFGKRHREIHGGTPGKSYATMLCGDRGHVKSRTCYAWFGEFHVCNHKCLPLAFHSAKATRMSNDKDPDLGEVTPMWRANLRKSLLRLMRG